jgi:serine acetyltransferase
LAHHRGLDLGRRHPAHNAVTVGRRVGLQHALAVVVAAEPPAP